MEKGQLIENILLGTVLLEISRNSFTMNTKEKIRKERGNSCLICGSNKVTFHHNPPEFYLKAIGENPDQTKYGFPFCRKCHDFMDQIDSERYKKILLQKGIKFYLNKYD